MKDKKDGSQIKLHFANKLIVYRSLMEEIFNGKLHFLYFSLMEKFIVSI